MENYSINLIEKTILIKTYAISKINYIISTIEMSDEYIKELNRIIFNHFFHGMEMIRLKDKQSCKIHTTED